MAPRRYAYNSSRGYGFVGRSYGGGRAVISGSRGFYRPYYTFRPRVSLGFGLWVGYPVAYPYYYGDPYYYSDPYYSPYDYPYPYAPYGYPPSAYPGYSTPAYPPQYPSVQGSVGVQPGPNSANVGGLSFDVTPSTAEVSVDGSFIGTVSQFTPSSQPFDVRPGHHRVEIRASGYRTLNFDVDVAAGQVTPLQGSMER